MICEEMQYSGTQTDAIGIYAVFTSVGEHPSTFFCPFNKELKDYLNKGVTNKGAARGMRLVDKRVFVNVTARETVVTDPDGNVLTRVSR